MKKHIEKETPMTNYDEEFKKAAEQFKKNCPTIKTEDISDKTFTTIDPHDISDLKDIEEMPDRNM